jgi:hypothetical protein
MVIRPNIAPAAITLVDARTGCKFTASKPFSHQYKKQRGGPNRSLDLSKFESRIRIEDVFRFTTLEEPGSRQRIRNFPSD